MTVVGFVSVKGAPGTTTLATLVAATWPEGRRAVVVECDPAGGDLAPRFHLAAKRGWPSFSAAVRRSTGAIAVDAHLQQLPGGVDVLVGSPGEEMPMSRALETLMASERAQGAGRDLLIDGGRVPSGTGRATGWLEQCDQVLVVMRNDVASAFRVRERSHLLRSSMGERVALIVVASESRDAGEIERFTGLPLFASVPFDPEAAAVASGRPASVRRLARSPMTASATRIGSMLTDRHAEGRSSPEPGGPTSGSGRPSGSPKPVPSIGTRAAGARRRDDVSTQASR